MDYQEQYLVQGNPKNRQELSTLVKSNTKQLELIPFVYSISLFTDIT